MKEILHDLKQEIAEKFWHGGGFDRLSLLLSATNFGISIAAIDVWIKIFALITGIALAATQIVKFLRELTKLKASGLSDPPAPDDDI